MTEFILKGKNISIYSILIIINCYLLWSNTNLKIEAANEKDLFKHEIKQKNRLKDLENLIVKNKKLINSKLNLISIWGGNGCGTCKGKMAEEFENYKKRFSNMFKFVYIGDNMMEPKMFGVNGYLTLLVKSEDELFDKHFKIMQPIVLLADMSGNILLAHEFILGDTVQFNQFNRKVAEMSELIH